MSSTESIRHVRQDFNYLAADESGRHVEVADDTRDVEAAWRRVPRRMLTCPTVWQHQRVPFCVDTTSICTECLICVVRDLAKTPNLSDVCRHSVVGPAAITAVTIGPVFSRIAWLDPRSQNRLLSSGFSLGLCICPHREHVPSRCVRPRRASFVRAVWSAPAPILGRVEEGSSLASVPGDPASLSDLNTTPPTVAVSRGRRASRP